MTSLAQKQLRDSVDFYTILQDLARQSPDAKVPADTKEVLRALETGKLSLLPEHHFHLSRSQPGRWELKIADPENEQDSLTVEELVNSYSDSEVDPATEDNATEKD
jgi:hypothetical protein